MGKRSGLAETEEDVAKMTLAEIDKEMERYSHEAKNLGYIDLNSVLFDHGKLREDLFLPDKLHFRPEGTAYAEFAQIVKPILTKAWESGAGLPRKSE